MGDPKDTLAARPQVLRNKFFQFKDVIAEQAPHITHLFDNEAHNTEEGMRQTRSEVIKHCFKKEGKKWVLDLANPYFKECKQRHMLATWERIKKHVFSIDGL